MTLEDQKTKGKHQHAVFYAHRQPLNRQQLLNKLWN